MTDQTPERDPLDELDGPEPADDGLPADAAEHDAEDPAPPDEADTSEAHAVEGAGDDEGDLGGEG